MKRHIVQGMAAALVYFCIVLFMPSGWAGTEQTVSSNLPEETQEVPPVISNGMGEAPAVVMIHNRPIVVFFAPLPGSTTEQRVKLAEERITRVLSGKNLGKVTSREIAPGIVISIGNNDLLLITPEDANPAFGQTKKEIVDRAVRNLTLAVDEVKEMRSPHFILMAAGYTLLATILYVATLWGLHRSSGWTEARVKKMEEKWMGKLNIKGVSLLEHGIQISHFLLRLTTWAVILFTTYSWLVFSLECFPHTRAWGESLGSYLFNAMGNTILGVVRYLPSLFTVVIIIICTRVLARMVKSLFQSVENGRVKFMMLDPEVARPTSRILIAMLWLFALIMAYPHLPGSGTMAFKGVTLFAGLIASLGTTSIVNQAAGGLVLMYSRAFKPGDFIKVGETEGVVTNLGILSTKIRTPRKEEVNIPNAVLVGNTSTNYTRLTGGAGVMIHTSVTIGYTTPWRKVQSLLLTAAGRTRELVSEPGPYVRQVGLSDFYVEYQLIVAVTKAEIRSEVLSALLGNIQDVFNENGEQIMSPHYMADTSEKQIIPKSKWFDLPADPMETES